MKMDEEELKELEHLEDFIQKEAEKLIEQEDD